MNTLDLLQRRTTDLRTLVDRRIQLCRWIEAIAMCGPLIAVIAILYWYAANVNELSDAQYNIARNATFESGARLAGIRRELDRESSPSWTDIGESVGHMKREVEDVRTTLSGTAEDDAIQTAADVVRVFELMCSDLEREVGSNVDRKVLIQDIDEAGNLLERLHNQISAMERRRHARMVGTGIVVTGLAAVLVFLSFSLRREEAIVSLQLNYAAVTIAKVVRARSKELDGGGFEDEKQYLQLVISEAEAAIDVAKRSGELVLLPRWLLLSPRSVIVDVDTLPAE